MCELDTGGTPMADPDRRGGSMFGLLIDGCGEDLAEVVAEEIVL
jgi:hypothetical protein